MKDIIHAKNYTNLELNWPKESLIEKKNYKLLNLTEKCSEQNWQNKISFLKFAFTRSWKKVKIAAKKNSPPVQNNQ